MNRNGKKNICEEVLITLRKIIRAIDQHSRHLVKQYGVTGPQLLILKELTRLNEIHISEIAKRVSLSQPTVTDILNRLETKNLIQRKRNEHDKRMIIVNVTEQGKMIIKKEPSLLQERFILEFNKLKEWEQTLILSSIQRIASMMKAKEISATPVLFSGPISATEEEVSDFLWENKVEEM
jgi:DNA-binding MarR family transcriptional regulator